jgi:MFS family permease
MEHTSLFKNRYFTLFLGTRFFLTFGIQMQAILVAWKIYNLSHDPLSLGLIGLTEAIPALGVALYAGHLADSQNKKNILIGCMILLLLSSIGMQLFSTNIFELDQAMQIQSLYFFVFVSGIARGFYGPASFSMIPALVTKNQLVKAGTLQSTAWQIAAIIGPALGGILYSSIDLEHCFQMVLLMEGTAFICLLNIKGDFKPAPIIEKESMYKRLKDGVQFVFKHKVILSALSLDLFSVLFGGATALLPIFANEILAVGSTGLGILKAAPSLGAAITMIFMSFQAKINNPGKKLLLVVGAFGLCMIAFGLSESFYLSVCLLFLSGAFDSVSVVIRSAIIQTQTPAAMRGRVAAVNTMFIGSSNEIGAFESGLAAKVFGTVPAVVGGGVITLMVVGITHVKAKAIRTFQFD